MVISRGRRWAWGTLALALAAGRADAGTPLPPDFVVPPSAANTLGAVPFSHQRHAAALGMVCLDCHAPGRFEMRRGGTPGVTMAAMTRGLACGACHNSQRTFGLRDAALCARCHRPG